MNVSSRLLHWTAFKGDFRVVFALCALLVLWLWSFIALDYNLLVIFATAVTPTAILAAVRLPGVVLAAYLLIPFYKAMLDPIVPVDLTPFLAVACFVLGLLGFFQNSAQGSAQNSRIPAFALALWTAVLAMMVAGALFAPDAIFAFATVGRFLLLVYLPLILCIHVATAPRLLIQFYASMLVFSGIAVFSSLLVLVASGFSERVSVFGANTIATGQAAVFGPLLGMSLYPILPKWGRIAVLSLIPFAAAAVIASGSRGPIFIGLAAIAVVRLIVNRHVLRNSLAIMVVGISALAALRSPVLVDIFPSASVSRIQVLLDALSRWDLSAVDTSTAARFRLFELAVDMFAERPLYGYGPGGFEWRMDQAHGYEVYFAPHNIYLQIASDFGVIGLTVIGLLIGCVLWKGWTFRRDPLAMGLFSLAVFVSLYGLVDLDLYTSRWMWGVLILFLAYRPDREKSRPDMPREGI